MNKKQYQHDSKRIKESARMNRDPYMHHMMIPRTQRIQKEQARVNVAIKLLASHEGLFCMELGPLYLITVGLLLPVLEKFAQ
jgi:hypothetical protein